MGLKIVGAGLGRTGTKSMQTALAQLGFGPCHHMLEVFEFPDSMPLWIEAAAGNPDWDAIFKHYQSAVDYPSAAYWRELAVHYPQARVLLTVRDPDEWFESVHATIMAPDSMARHEDTEVQARFFATVRRHLPPQLDDRRVMTAFFRAHVQAVIAAIEPDRLLVYQVGEGWERLCRFLGVPVPSAPFPRENSREDFISRVRARAATTAAR